MDGQKFHGVFPILLTPFDQLERIDVDSLQNLVDFLIDAHVDGLGIALGSEIGKLSEDERRLVTRTVVDQARGRVPIVVNTSGTCTQLAIHYSKYALEDGADALMLIPPSAGLDTELLVSYFAAVNDIVDIPIFIQDLSSPHVSAHDAKIIAETCPMVQYIKVESHPTPKMVGEVQRIAADDLVIFGGGGGRFIIEELRRGSQGTMPGCSNPEAFVNLWANYTEGDEQQAIDLFYSQVIPINHAAEQGWGAFHFVHKEILRQRGVIATAIVRGPMPPLDDDALRDLQLVIDTLYPEPSS